LACGSPHPAAGCSQHIGTQEASALFHPLLGADREYYVQKIAMRATARRAALIVAAMPVAFAGVYTVTTTAAQASATAVQAPKAIVAVDSPASACNIAGDLCFWVNSSEKGEKGAVDGSNGNWSALGGGTTCPDRNWNNCASSFDNDNSSVAFRLWQFTGDTGGEYCLTPGSSISNAANQNFSNGDPMNDAVSADFRESGSNC
jgi:hypothetical protein